MTIVELKAKLRAQDKFEIPMDLTEEFKTNLRSCYDLTHEQFELVFNKAYQEVGYLSQSAKYPLCIPEVRMKLVDNFNATMKFINKFNS